MEGQHSLRPAAIEEYLRSRRRLVRAWEWVRGRKFLSARFEERPKPIVVIAHSFRDRAMAGKIRHAIEQDWSGVPKRCRDAYDEILFEASGIVVIQLRRKNLCGCLGHRHPVVKEAPFAETHEAFGGATVGEIDIAYERIETWPALPLTDIAFDSRFLEGSRLKEFREHQFRLRTLSVLLHEIHHWVFPQEPEASVRERSLAFYREAIGHYVEDAVATLSLTIDRSFSRFG